MYMMLGMHIDELNRHENVVNELDQSEQILTKVIFIIQYT